MHLGYADSRHYLTALAAAAPRLESVSLFVLPSFPVLAAAREALAGTQIAVGAQDGHWEDSGPHTGSVSAAMLAEIGCELMEVGHAERRRDFGEDDAMIARKAVAAANHRLVPVVCVGETTAGDEAVEVVGRQLEPVLAELPGNARLVIAYEPVWAIGANRTASAEHVAPVLSAVREACRSRSGLTRILYGGSVVPEGAREMIDAGADGVFASRSALTLPGLERLVAAVAR